MDTIIALSSGLPAAIAIIRISGEDSLKLLKTVFRTKKDIEPRVVSYGKLELDGKIEDSVTAIYYKAPFSYNGEDIVEIFTHGSRPIINALINSLIKRGARLAQAGEFTLRAYLNNKLDLTASEGIISLINAQTDMQARSAYKLLSGSLKEKIQKLQKKLLNAIAYIEADLDYPEEDIAFENNKNILSIIDSLKDEIFSLKETYNQGRLIKDGAKVVLIGDTNVGKSSIINALLKKERVIVSDYAGTTRDIVEESYFYKGQRFILTDTAGIRETDNEIEKIGIKKALEEAQNADILLSVSIAGQDFFNIENKKNNTVYVENKIDLCESERNIIKVSALKNINIESLKEEIYKKAFEKEIDTEAEIIMDLRHYNCLDLCYNGLCETLSGLENNEIMDCISAQLREAYDALGQITGIIGSDEIVNEIFSNFCVGK